MKDLSSTIHLVFALIVLLIMGSCTTTREIHHQITLHDTLHRVHLDTLFRARDRQEQQRTATSSTPRDSLTSALLFALIGIAVGGMLRGYLRK